MRHSVGPPRVSVVIPSYNHARYVREAAGSVLAQDVADLELIVVDDGSSDESVEIVQGLGDPRVRLVRQPNQGTHAALNNGLALARGRWLAILNSDDRWAPGRLRAALDVFAREPETALVGSWIELIDADGRPLSVKHGFDDLDPWPVEDPALTFKADRDLRTALLNQNYWATTSNYVFPRTTWEKHGPFRPLRFAHDWDFALRVQRESPARLLEAPLVQYRVHDANTIRQDPPAMVYEVCWVLAVHVPLIAAGAFWSAGEARRALQLLRSVHVYGCDRVLWAMTAHVHHGPPGAELRLLDPQDPSRRVYLDEVERILSRRGSAGATSGPAPGSRLAIRRGLVLARARSLAARLRNALTRRRRS
jgi:glycosyltransferase involved in cell wall biosynthesis